jgi:hypothetical protein
MIFLECFNDEATLRALGFPKNQWLHELAKSRVAHALDISRRNSDIALVDQDPGQSCPAFLREFKAADSRPDLGLCLYRHPESGKRFIEIQPDLELWLYSQAQAIGISPVTHHLPKRHEDLHKNPKKHRGHLENFVKACLAAKSPHLAKLAEWLKQA